MMISQRDVLQFFNIVDILSDPAKAKAELVVFQNLHKDADAKTKDIEKREIAVTNKEQAANQIIAAKSAGEKWLEDETNRLSVKEAGLNDLEQKLLALDAKQKQLVTLLDEKAVKLRNKEVELRGREEHVVERETNYNNRAAALREKEDDYAARMKQLRTVIS